MPEDHIYSTREGQDLTLRIYAAPRPAHAHLHLGLSPSFPPSPFSVSPGSSARGSGRATPAEDDDEESTPAGVDAADEAQGGVGRGAAFGGEPHFSTKTKHTKGLPWALYISPTPPSISSASASAPSSPTSMTASLSSLQSRKSLAPPTPPSWLLSAVAAHGIPLISAAYTPGHAMEDAEAAAEWCFANLSAIGVEPARSIVVGGALAADLITEIKGKVLVVVDSKGVGGVTQPCVVLRAGRRRGSNVGHLEIGLDEDGGLPDGDVEGLGLFVEEHCW